MQNLGDFWKDVIFKTKRVDIIKYWEDPWLLQNPLSTEFPSLYSMARSKQTFINQVGIQHGEEINWNFDLSGRLGDTEVLEAASLLHLLDGFRFMNEKKDDLNWKPNKIRLGNGLGLGLLGSRLDLATLQHARIRLGNELRSLNPNPSQFIK
ncbi:hypothetical protein BVC80_741g9 [Macleaya cordata]|uniref:Uncharacterized protein n=1 Tax=Macleaya cordata TaxID=56857 RepID=A0A200QN17_MACCD|nr:hypothetical protein BVC80_741g9 [Macleaya cordata]